MNPPNLRIAQIRDSEYTTFPKIRNRDSKQNFLWAHMKRTLRVIYTTAPHPNARAEL